MADNVSINPILLKECEESAKNGAEYVESCLNSIDAIIANEKDNIKSTMLNIKNQHSEIQDNPVWQDMISELNQLEDYSKVEIQRIKDDIKNRSKEMEKFTIVVFGKTTAGKSTLMEILTHGDGKSIGHGGQRTTRDVRSYEWNGLKIWDVPGVAAFDGKEDERIAYEAAKKGDLIIFLLTNNNPGPNEADALAELRKFGKPILGIMNVKISNNCPDEIFQAQIEKSYASKDISDIMKQFYEFGLARNQDWHNIEFIPAHLKCAFDSMSITDTKKKALYESLSHFSRVTEHIADYVTNRGRVIRLKTFVDIVSKPLFDLTGKTLRYVRKLETNKTVLMEINSKFSDKIVRFKSALKSDIAKFKESHRSLINVRLDRFVEDNYENKEDELNKNFKKFWESQNFSRYTEEFIEKELNSYNFLLKDMEKSFDKNYEFNSGGFGNIKFEGGELIDTKKWIRYISGATFFFRLTPVWFVITTVFNIVSEKIFDDIDTKRRKAKENLKKQIWEQINTPLQEEFSMLDQLYNQIEAHIDEVEKRNKIFENMFVELLNIHQKNILPKFQGILSDLNKKLIENALNDNNIPIKKVERIMGEVATIYTKDKNYFMGSRVARLTDILQEKIIVVGGM